MTPPVLLLAGWPAFQLAGAVHVRVVPRLRRLLATVLVVDGVGQPLVGPPPPAAVVVPVVLLQRLLDVALLLPVAVVVHLVV